MKRLCIALIRLYQKILSPLKGRPSCRFRPTCSEYTVGVISEWGALVGIFLGIWRILRCNPFSRGGFNPVPRRVVRPRYPKKREFDPYADRNLTFFLKVNDSDM